MLSIKKNVIGTYLFVEINGNAIIVMLDLIVINTKTE